MDEFGRVISLDISIHGKLVHLINTYFPNKHSEQYKFIYDLYPYFHSSHPVLWAGDHNITTDNMMDRIPRRRKNDKFGKNILQIIRCLDLKDVCRDYYPNKNDIFTFTQDLIRSRIDKIIVQNCFTVKSYDHQIVYQSDHEMIISHIQLDEFIEKGYGVWKNNALVFQNEIFQEEFKELWIYWKAVYDSSCPIGFWMSCKKQIKHFLIDTGKILAQQKRNLKERELQDLSNLYNQSTLMNNNRAQTSINLYLDHKKALAKLEIDKVKEQIENKKYLDFIEREKPTKCFFSKV